MRSGLVEALARELVGEVGLVGAPVLLVRVETSPDDIKGMARAQGILTARGGMTSHAAIVSRELGIPCVVGTTDATIRLANGTLVTVDGRAGTVMAGAAPVVAPLFARAARPRAPPLAV